MDRHDEIKFAAPGINQFDDWLDLNPSINYSAFAPYYFI